MKKLIITAITILILTGCSTREPDRFYSEEHSFSIRFPSSWKTRVGYMGSIVRAENPDIGVDVMFQENMNIITDTLPEGMTIDRYFESGKKMLKEALPGLKDDGQAVMEINGLQAAKFSYSYPLKPALMKAVVYNILRKKKIYIITCTADSTRFDNLRETFDRSARSFKTE
jgi:hypothetical protein